MKLYNFDIELCADVYEPSDDTFFLADNLDVKEGAKVLEIGTGTGILAMIASRKALEVLAVDINPKAVECAKNNVKLNNINNIQVVHSNLFSNVKGKFNLIIFNPPYVPTGSREKKDNLSKAWDGGISGRKTIDRFLRDVKHYLLPGSRVILLESSLSDYKKTIDFLENNGFKAEIIAGKKLDWEKLVVVEAELL